MAKEITIPHTRAFIAALAVVPVSTTLSMVYGTQFVGKFFLFVKSHIFSGELVTSFLGFVL